MIFTDLFENTDQPLRVKFQGTDHDIGEERYVFTIDDNPEVFIFQSDEDRPDPDSPSFEEILARVQRDGAVEHYRITPAEQQAIAKKIAAERQRYLDQRRSDMAEGLPQTLRKIVPGYAKREIDKKMDAGKFGKTDADKDANFQRYKKIQDKLKEQGVSEAMKPSDVPPSMRDRLTMRDIEAERPEGAFRFRVTFPDGHANDYMTFDAARAAAERAKGRITRLSETQKTAHKGAKGSNPRLERILKMLRATHPTAQNDLEALILDFRGQQAQDRTDIARLDAENDMEEADIERLEQLLQQLKQRRGTAAVAEAAPNEATRFYQQQYQREMQRHGSARLAKELASRATAQRFGANWNIVISQPGQPDRYATPTDAEMLDRGRRELRDLMTKEDSAEGLQEDDIDDAMKDYLARGGKIKQEPARMPRLGTRLRQHGSRHIGQGREGRAGKLSGRGANTNPGSNKPVVTAESLRDGEYHVATITLDNGSQKKVRITTDEGFRDRIERHFQKQGRRVTDIDVDYSVRSELDEAKKKPQPTNPELWSRAKAAAKSKFDVYPSAYANAFAAKWYKSKGGGWRMGKPKKD